MNKNNRKKNNSPVDSGSSVVPDSSATKKAEESVLIIEPDNTEVLDVIEDNVDIKQQEELPVNHKIVGMRKNDFFTQILGSPENIKLWKAEGWRLI